MEAGTVSKIPTFKWKVNVNSFGEKKIGDSLMSPIFSFTNSEDGRETSWRLVLFPKGDTKSCQGYVSVFLKSLNKGKINAGFRISFLNNSDISKKDNEYNSSFSYGKNTGWSKFAPESYVRDAKNNLLKDNKLTVLCTVMVEEKVEVKGPSEETLCRLSHFEKFKKLLNSGEFSDIIVSTGEEEVFKLHRCILSASSSVFETMFTTDLDEDCKVKIEDVSHQVLQELFSFLYTGKVNNIKDIVGELWSAADKYCIDELKLLCEKALCDNLTKDNVLEYLNLAIVKNHEKLKNEAIKCISLNLEALTIEGVLENLAKEHPEVYHQIVVQFFNK